MTLANIKFQEIRQLQAQNLLHAARLNNQSPAEIDPILAGEIERGEVEISAQSSVSMNSQRRLPARALPPPQRSIVIALLSATLGLAAGYLIWGLVR